MAGYESVSHYSFNDSGLLLAHCSETSKLRIWDTSTGNIKQEYTKNLHLTSPCTCLYWLQVSKRGSPKKKKFKSSFDESNELVLLGTKGGDILIYDVTTNDIKHILEGHTGRVNCLSSAKSLFSCSNDKSIIEWDLESFKIRSKWKTETEKVGCILALSNGKELLSASCSIKLWDLKEKQIIKTFTGHGTEIISLLEMPGHEDYFITSAMGDRVLSAWSLTSKEKITSVASFILQGSPLSIHVQTIDPDSPSILYAVTDVGTVHIFKHKLNGNISKPMKPVSNLSVASDNENGKQSHPLPIYAALPLNNDNFIIAYGNPVFLLFEIIALSDVDKEHHVLVREDKRKIVAPEFNNKVKITEVNENTEYEVPSTVPTKRTKKKKLDVDVPLEDRLDNLALANTLLTDSPKKDNMAQLLVQGLQSKDRTILETVLLKLDEAVINSTVKNLPAAALVPLLRELLHLLNGKTFTSRCAVCWLAAVLRHHSGVLLSNPGISDIFQPVLSSVETRLSLLPSLLRLKGRLGLVTSQIVTKTSEDVQITNEPLISYQEQDSSDEGELGLLTDGSDSDDNWDEFSETEDQDEEIDIDDK